MTEVKFHITIGPQVPIWQKMTALVCWPVSMLMIPVVNHNLLGGHWWIDTLGGLFGFFLFAVVVIRSMAEDYRTRRFDTAEEAAEWVREWK